ncbi:MAG: hypothetical protein AB7M12_10655 [Hyphomonadaceae bacterium]
MTAPADLARAILQAGAQQWIVGVVGALLGAIASGVVALFFARRKRRAVLTFDQAVELQGIVARALQLDLADPSVQEQAKAIVQELNYHEKAAYLTRSRNKNKQLMDVSQRLREHLRGLEFSVPQRGEPAYAEFAANRDGLRADWRKFFSGIL